MIRAVIVLSVISAALAFTAPSAKNVRASVSLNAKSKSVPFLEQPKALTGTTMQCHHSSKEVVFYLSSAYCNWYIRSN